MLRREGNSGRVSDATSPWEGWADRSQGDRTIRKGSSQVQLRILGRKGREFVSEPTHRLNRRGLKRSLSKVVNATDVSLPRGGTVRQPNSYHFLDTYYGHTC